MCCFFPTILLWGVFNGDVYQVWKISLGCISLSCYLRDEVKGRRARELTLMHTLRRQLTVNNLTVCFFFFVIPIECVIDRKILMRDSNAANWTGQLLLFGPISRVSWARNRLNEIVIFWWLSNCDSIFSFCLRMTVQSWKPTKPLLTHHLPTSL